MVKLRRNHASPRKGLQATFRMVVFFILVLGGLVCGIIYLKSHSPAALAPTYQEFDNQPRTYLPTSTGQLIHHTYYSLSYLEEYEQAEWTAYINTRSRLKVPNVPRYDKFIPDYAVSTRSAFYRDYSGSGYTRGHMVPAGDMAFDTMAMRESFFMSNMSPQTKIFNQGIWRELEENIRDWTYTHDTLYIITGPIFDQNTSTIGSNKVGIPHAFFKVILDYAQPDIQGVGFLIPHDESVSHLSEFMTTIDSVEAITGLDFFNDMIDDVLEEKIESNWAPQHWKISDKRYQLRLNEWNKR